MKRLITACLLFVAGVAVCTAQTNEKQKPRFRFGIGAGVVLPKTTGPDIDARKKQGYDQTFDIGGKFGFEFHIPIYKGLFIRSAIYGTYSRSGESKESSTTKQSRRLNLDTYKYYDVTETRSSKNATTSTAWGTQIPVVLGYSIPISRKSEVFLGAVGYVGMSIAGNSKTEESTSVHVTPDRDKETRSTHKSSESNPFEGMAFNDKISYGIGAQVGIRAGKFFFHYTFLESLKRTKSQTDPKKKNGSHSNELTIGLYF